MATSIITWAVRLCAAILNLVVDEIPFFFGFNGNWVSSLTLADVSVPIPSFPFFRKYIPRVLKRNVWAFYEIKTMIMLLIMTTMMVKNKKIKAAVKDTNKVAGGSACLYYHYNYWHYHHQYQFLFAIIDRE